MKNTKFLALLIAFILMFGCLTAGIATASQYATETKPLDTDGLIPFVASDASLGEESPDPIDPLIPRYYATVGDLAVTIDAYKLITSTHPSESWINVTLTPLSGGTPLTCNFYTDKSNSSDRTPEGALFLGDTPEGIYKIAYGSVDMGALEVLAPGASKVIALGGAVPIYGRPNLNSSFDARWLVKLFTNGYLYYTDHSTYKESQYEVFRDGSVYLSLIAANIKPSDISEVYIGEESVEFNVIPAGVYSEIARQYLLKLDDSLEIPLQEKFTVVVQGDEYDVTLSKADNPDYYLDLTNIQELELSILPNSAVDPPETLTVRVFDNYYIPPGISALWEGELTFENDRYTFNLPEKYFFLDEKNDIYVFLYNSSADTDFRSAHFNCYDNIPYVYFPLDDTGYTIWGPKCDIRANINEQKFWLSQYYRESYPVYQPDPVFSLVDSAFNPVSGVTITKDAREEGQYNFNAAQSLEIDKEYYLLLGDFPLVKLTAKSNLTKPDSGDYNSIDGNWEYSTDRPFWFSVSMPLINPDEWSVKLTSLLPGTSPDPVTYSVKDKPLLTPHFDANSSSVKFETEEPLAAGLYKVQYYRNGIEVKLPNDTDIEIEPPENTDIEIEPPNNADADEFDDVSPQVILVRPPQTTLRITSVSPISWWDDDTLLAFLDLDGNATSNGTTPALTATFYAITADSIDFNFKKVNIPAATVNDNGSPFIRQPARLINAAGVTPGYNYLVISDDQDKVLYSNILLITASWLAGKDSKPSTAISSGTWVPSMNQPPAQSWTNPYSDMFDTDWFFEYVRYVTEKGLMKGTSDGKFSPDVTMTRAMLVTVLYRLEDKPEVSGDIPFPDVKAGEWYSDAILWASQNSIVDGYNNGTFGLNDPVTREQAVTILYRYAEFKEKDVSVLGNLLRFTDRNDISDWARDALRWAVAEEIIQGRTPTTIVPQGTSTRAELAAIIMRYAEG